MTEVDDRVVFSRNEVKSLFNGEGCLIKGTCVMTKIRIERAKKFKCDNKIVML